MRLLTVALLLGSALMASAAPEPVVFAAYNLENFRGDEPSASPRPAHPKSEAAVAAMVEIVREIGPDILGVCELGAPEQLTRLQSLLRAAGLDLPHTEFVAAVDADRHLALLSRYPIVERHSQANLTYELNGAPRKVERGLLDVTVQVNSAYAVRLLGVHLKSKLPVPEGEALLRRHEAEVVRRYLEQTLAAAPESNLLLYGDCNDYRNEPAYQALTGPRGSPFHLTELPAADAQGERWTHYWRPADLYARIDYLFASLALLPEIVPNSARIYRGEHWAEASDHRPIFTSLLPVDGKR